MADEIGVLPGRHYKLLFLYPIGAPAEYPQASGTNVVPRESSEMPDDALAILTPEEIQNIDNGIISWEIVQFSGSEDMTNQQLLDRGREIYAAKKARFDENYAYIYHNRIGARFDADVI